MESHRKGELTEAVVVAELKRRNVPVMRPFGDNERYDVVVETPSRSLLRLQVKTGRLNRGTVVFDGTSMHTNSEGNVYKPYEGDVDYFLVYSHDLDRLYLVPESEVGSSMALRVEEPAQPDPKINPAEEYRFDRVWPPDSGIDESPSSGSEIASKDRSIDEVLDTLEELSVTAYRKACGTSVCDLVAGTPHASVRMTIRTATESEGRVRMSRTADADVRRDTDEPDYYALYCPPRDETYLLNTEEFDATLSLRTDDPDQIQHNTRWAEDYRLETVWPPDGTPRVSSKSAVGAATEAFERIDVPAGVVHDDSTPYDLLAETSEGFARVAVVPAWVSRGCLRLKPDTKTGIDAFVVSHRETDTCYAVDANDFERSISLRVEEPDKPDPSITWADEYELASNWPA